LIRASYSSNIKERRDCSTAIFDARGQVIAQAEHIPMHLGSLLGTVEGILRRYPLGDLAPGDMFIVNDPYAGGGTHLPDINLVAPVFAGGEPFGFVANIAHHADRTGERIRNIWDEGLRIPPIRLLERGRLREDVMELLLANFALPDERRGDFRAQLAVNRLGERRLGELIARWGLPTVRAACDELLAYGERKIRAAIAAVPDGVYRFTDAMDDDGVSDEPIPVAVNITVQGDTMRLDFTGRGGFYVYLETIGGGAGGAARADGLDGVQVHVTNTSNLPVECLETEYPLLVDEYALVEESGGAGRRRGGMGIRRAIEVVGHEA